MVELTEEEENDVEGGASAWGPDKGYTSFTIDVVNIAIYHQEAYMKVSGTKIYENEYRVINGFGVKWKWIETGTIKFMFQAGPYATNVLGLQFWGIPQGKSFKKNTYNGAIDNYDGYWKITRY